MSNAIRKKIIKEIENDGWHFVRQKGSHQHFKHPIKKGLVTVPYEITKNIELSVMRQAGIDRRKLK